MFTPVSPLPVSGCLARQNSIIGRKRHGGVNCSGCGFPRDSLVRELFRESGMFPRSNQSGDVFRTSPRWSRSIVSTVRMHPIILLPIAAALLFLVIYIPAFVRGTQTSGPTVISDLPGDLELIPLRQFEDFKLPEGENFRIGIVSDLDKRSKVTMNGKNHWVSFFRTGFLTRGDGGKYSISWEEERLLSSQMNEGGRGMELSELVKWRDGLYAVDDRTGIVFEILGTERGAPAKKTKAIPRYILPDGDGNDTGKGMKCEWASVYGGDLLIGSIGKEWTDSEGNVISYNPQWVKRIAPSGKVSFENWSRRFDFLREKTGTKYPGYLLHEAITFDPLTKHWLIAPRRLSTEKYDEMEDNLRATNAIFRVDELFNSFDQRAVGPPQSLRGVSSIKIIPGTARDIVVLRTEEDMVTEAQKSYISVFNLDGTILLEDTFISDCKFEGVEFL